MGTMKKKIVEEKSTGDGKRGGGGASDLASLSALVTPHIESFDYFVNHGLQQSALAIRPVELVQNTTQTKLRNILLFLLPIALFDSGLLFFENSMVILKISCIVERDREYAS
mgnify:CR=1 FL=1